MNIGLWNIDHPETQSGVSEKERRFREISEYLVAANCDALIITEANAAIDLPGYFQAFSNESPFKSKRRFYGAPNSYHQVGIYSKNSFERIEVDEPINGILCKLFTSNSHLLLYGNVVTIKDKWLPTSSKTYTDRLNEQISAIQSIQGESTLVGGDFNLRLGWPQRQSAHQKVKNQLASSGWVWPTELREDTVQHILHSSDLHTELAIDFSIKYDSEMRRGLSDHPFVKIKLSMKPSAPKNNRHNEPMHLTPTRRHAGCLVASLPASVAPSVRGR